MGILYIVPTPIGNLQDITIRALDILFRVQYIACEDTRKTGQLLKLLRDKYSSFMQNNDVSPQLISFYEQNERQRVPNVLNVLQNGFDIALVSDAGTPLVSDPGFRLIQACYENGIEVVSLPGASSVIVSLAASGLPTDKFTFLGYPPQKSGHRMTFYENVKQSATILSSTYVLFEAPHKIAKTLEEMYAVFGDIEIVIARELTKVHEEVKKKLLSEWITDYKKRSPKGEYILLFHL